MTPAEPGWEAQAAEFSAAGLLHDTEPSSEDYDAEPSREGFDEHRRHLRLVREQARRRANGRRLLVSAGIALASAILAVLYLPKTNTSPKAPSHESAA